MVLDGLFSDPTIALNCHVSPVPNAEESKPGQLAGIVFRSNASYYERCLELTMTSSQSGARTGGRAGDLEI